MVAACVIQSQRYEAEWPLFVSLLCSAFPCKSAQLASLHFRDCVQGIVLVESVYVTHGPTPRDLTYKLSGVALPANLGRPRKNELECMCLYIYIHLHTPACQPGKTQKERARSSRLHQVKKLVKEIEAAQPLLCQMGGVSENRVPYKSTLDSRILIIRNSKEGTLIFGKSQSGKPKHLEFTIESPHKKPQSILKRSSARAEI